MKAQTISAPGAVQLSSPPVIPASRAGACQPESHPAEPTAGLKDSKAQAGGIAMSRRSIMNALVSAAAITALPAVATSSPLVSQTPPASQDAELIELSDQLLEVQARAHQLFEAVEDMEVERSESNLPEELRIRPRDLELGKKPQFEDDLFWFRPCDMTQWRDLEQFERTSLIDTADEFSLSCRRVQPSDELIARAAEIIKAKEEVGRRPYPRGYKKLRNERNRFDRLGDELLERIANTPAKSLDGMFAKLRCGLFKDPTIRTMYDFAYDNIAASILRDVQTLGSRVA